MTNKTYYTIEGHEGRWSVSETNISELGFILVKFYNEDKKVFMNINMGLLEDALRLPWSNRPESTIQAKPTGDGLTHQEITTRFLQSVEEVVINDRFYYKDAEGQYYRMVEMDEDFDFVDPDDAEFAYVFVSDPYAEEEDQD
jgi:hypothetical protein